ncbi:inositol-phosphate transport system permease protein [Streptococcus rupicaprae]|uniref:Inositol-phosphate transport system permease protein n=1 Tax=Streptococcus rupicaprae TaxID=759619 RepID=A0ABV2FGI1_9STRE
MAKRPLNLEKKHERIAIAVMCLCILPIVFIYGKFFLNAFLNQDTGGFTLENFKFLTETVRIDQTNIDPVGQSMWNTIYFTVIVTVFEVVFSCMAGYALSRLEFKGKNFLTWLLLVLRMFPGMLLLIGVVYVLMYLKILNTMVGVILVAIAFRLPGSSFIIRNFFLQIPRDIENSALVDGCNRLTAFFQVIIHMVKPGLASTSMFAFMAAWSNYILFNVLIFNTKTPVLATYLRKVSSNEQMIADYGIFSAMALVYMLPVVIFFIVSQGQLMKGNVSGGKGI